MITSKECAQFIEKPHQGDEININMVSNLKKESQNKLKFVNVYSREHLEIIYEDVFNCVIVTSEYEGKLKGPHIISDNPRRDFCKIANKFFSKSRENHIESSAIVSKNARVGPNVYIGHHVVIEDYVEIGSNTVLLHNVVVSEGCRIGSNCLVKSGSIIGQRGFGFDRDLEGIPVSFPHYGKVIIGNNVEIGALNTIASGTLSDTKIADFVKTDDHVHIAHNVKIGSGTFIAACAEISGSVIIGKEVWIGPNSAVIDKVIIEDHAFVGIGAVVTRDVQKKARVIGYPAKVFIEDHAFVGIGAVVTRDVQK
jgi:UDP-3-O-[3-hydroxymyristoyl] glucosamine N-acyltransferase